MPLVNFFFWFLLAALAVLVYALLSWLKKAEAADLAYLARLAEVQQEGRQPIYARSHQAPQTFYDLGQVGGAGKEKAAG